jgi:hypothetical protein
MGGRVWLAIGAIAVAERGLSVVIRVVMIIGGIVASEGWVLLRLVLRGDATVESPSLVLVINDTKLLMLLYQV